MSFNQTQEYMRLRQQGLSGEEAFRRVWPNGPTTAEDQAKKQAKAQQMSGLGATAGMVGGVYGARKLMDVLGSSAPETATQVATNTAVNPTVVAQAGSTVTPQLPISHSGVSAADKAFLNGSDSVTGAPTVLGSETLAQGLGAAGVGLGAYNAFQGAKKGNELQAGLGGLGVGLGLNTLGVALGPIGWGAMIAAPVIASQFAHESTRDHAKKNTSKLLGMGKDNSKWQNYVQGMRAQYNSAPVNKETPFAGKYKTWDEYKKAGLEASDLTGVYGNLKTFGPDWANLSFDQQKAVTQGIINAGLYDSKKGEVIITDAAAAQKIRDSVLGKQQPKQQQQQQAPKRSLAYQKAEMKQNNDFRNQLAKNLYGG